MSDEVVPRNKGGRPRSTERKPDTSVMLVCNSEWKAWLKAFAKSQGLSFSELIEVMVEEGAQRRGFGSPPARVDIS